MINKLNYKFKISLAFFIIKKYKLFILMSGNRRSHRNKHKETRSKIVTKSITRTYKCSTIEADFKVLDATFGIGQPNNLKIHSFTKKKNAQWGLLSSLSVQWAHALAPGAVIFLIQAESNKLNDLLYAVD